jgi:hypothetical protein
VALGESDAQAWRERKVSRGGVGWWRTAGCFLFYSGRGGGEGVVKAKELPALMG